ncbi:MAG: hypothetical protein ABI866_13340 [Dokdonella sp.]
MKSSLLDRLLAALPDSLTALFFLSVWIRPLDFGHNGVRNGTLIMLVEFILVHASGVLGAQLFNPVSGRGKKILSVLAFGIFYIFFILIVCRIFNVWWPVLALSWLLVGKFMIAVNSRLPSDERKRRMQSDWGISAMAYLAGVFAALNLPVPQFGLSPDAILQMDLLGGSGWVEQPQRVMAFGAFYFTVLAWFKFKQYALPTKTLPKSSPSHGL